MFASPIVVAVLRYWKLAGLALLLLALAVQTIRLGHRSNQLERAQINLNEVRAELKRITTVKNEQGKRTETNLGEAKKLQERAEDRARRIEEAPAAPDCATPPEIMGADL